ncbi:uncharacterized protein LOC110105670 [Dendrobium catenatum]|uniref:uncharacterized protein LOC110105670 n=1 Tax=Dendrobium catenatum TaxID=906689 RepID=UPI0009F47091|nr:uncharacterized protein LOC110105670 [Dendrobium catenatum]
MGLMALKVDMEQAYDCMAWDTLSRVMEAMGFSSHFIHWVTECITLPWLAFLLNGNRSQWINARSGLRQGCPLSPYLFILCSELLIKALWQHGERLGVQIVANGKRVSHLLYNDDILIFAEAKPDNARRIQHILTDYCGWTGQKVNHNNLAIMFSKRFPHWKGRQIARQIGFNAVSSIEYLGIPLVMRKLIKADFSNLVAKASTKRKTETGGGLHYVPWSELCKPADQGGLGFHASSVWQGPLRDRLALNFIRQPNILMHRILIGKYGTNPWKVWPGHNISVSWRVINDGVMALQPIVRWSIGDGSGIDVLGDIWIMDRRLDQWPTFEDLAHLENNKVSFLLNDSREWNEDLVLRHFGDPMTAQILAIPCGQTGTKDSPELI